MEECAMLIFALLNDQQPDPISQARYRRNSDGLYVKWWHKYIGEEMRDGRNV